MKYKSELLSELIEKNGHTTTKVPHYESECENEFISEVRGAYPKLIDYSGEWLNYVNNHVNIGKFPTERVENVTNARFENVVPYGYKSAILKGQTLVNIFKQKNHDSSNRPYLSLDGDFVAINQSEIYTIKFFNAPIDKVQQFRVVERHKPFVDTIYASSNDTFTFTTTNDFTNFESLIIQVVETSSGIITDEELANIKVVLIKGDYTNVDIPYFEGMQSVKMPVLTTTGKNLFDINNVIQQEGVVVKGNSILITENRDYPDNIIYTFENAPTESVLSFDLSSNDVQEPGGALASIWYEDGTNIWITTSRKAYINTKKITDIKLHNWCKGTHIFSNIQLEKGTTTTSYEPYKSNILTVNEEVTLRGIGDVKDTLDLTTGELTQKVCSVTLNGEEVWSKTNSNNTHTMYTHIVDELPGASASYTMLCDKIKTEIYINTAAKTYESITIRNGTTKQVLLCLSNDKASDVVALKQWLSQNPITVQYPFATPTIKTVVLSCLDENNNPTKFKPYEGVMYAVTSSETLPPLLDMEVPVEAINQNLASFI